MFYRVLIFLAINFGALALGSIFTGQGVPSDWYQSLNKAPWTPPGWVFGAAWTTIMVCFSFYMAYAWSLVPDRRTLMLLFLLQFVLNVVWNPVFFHYHAVGAGLAVISALTLLVMYFLVAYFKDLDLKSLLVLPYAIWLIIATSLNGYVLFNN